MEKRTVKECKEYLINQKGWTLIKRCSTMNWYYWKTKNDDWSDTRIWTMKEMRYAVERMHMKDWSDAQDEKLRNGIQQSLFHDWEYVS